MAQGRATSAWVRASTLAIVGACLYLCGCSINQHGCARLRVYRSTHATLLRIDSIGIHLATGWGDRGLFIGACSRWAIFPAAPLDLCPLPFARPPRCLDVPGDDEPPEPPEPLTAIEPLGEHDRLRPIDPRAIRLDALEEPVAWGVHATALSAAWTATPRQWSLGLGRRSRAVLCTRADADSLVLIVMGSCEDLDAGRAYARVLRFGQE